MVHHSSGSSVVGTLQETVSPTPAPVSTAETYVFGDGLQPLLFVTLFGVALLCAGIMCMRKQRQDRQRYW